jgi:hypothetical protein
MTVRAALSSIPKLYVPISPWDVPQHVHRHIIELLDKSSDTLKRCLPLEYDDSTITEWGAPGTPLEGIHLRRAAIKSVDLVAQRLSQWPHLSRLHQGCQARSIRSWFKLLVDNHLIDRRLARNFVDSWEVARWTSRPVSVEHYLQLMRLLSCILQALDSKIIPSLCIANGSNGDTSAGNFPSDFPKTNDSQELDPLPEHNGHYL